MQKTIAHTSIESVRASINQITSNHWGHSLNVAGDVIIDVDPVETEGHSESSNLDNEGKDNFKDDSPFPEVHDS